MAYMFTFESMIHGYHEYQMIWGAPAIGEKLDCFHELGNSHNRYARVMKKTIGLGGDVVVGHVPRRISAICSLGGRYSADLPQSGLEIQAKLTLTTISKEEANKVKKFIEGVLNIDVTQDVTAIEERVEAATGVSNSAPIANISCKFGESVSTSGEVVNLLDHWRNHQRKGLRLSTSRE